MPEPDRIIRLKTVLNRCGLSRSTVYRKIKDGTFPRQIPISTNGAGWSEAALNRWIANPPAYRASELQLSPAKALPRRFAFASVLRRG
jgi:prophage regulatory protein